MLRNKVKSDEYAKWGLVSSATETFFRGVLDNLNDLQLEKNRVKKGTSASDKVKCVPERLLITSRVRRGMRILGGAVKAVLY